MQTIIVLVLYASKKSDVRKVLFELRLNTAGDKGIRILCLLKLSPISLLQASMKISAEQCHGCIMTPLALLYCRYLACLLVSTHFQKNIYYISHSVLWKLLCSCYNIWKCCVCSYNNSNCLHVCLCTCVLTCSTAPFTSVLLHMFSQHDSMKLGIGWNTTSVQWVSSYIATFIRGDAVHWLFIHTNHTSLHQP